MYVVNVGQWHCCQWYCIVDLLHIYLLLNDYCCSVFSMSIIMATLWNKAGHYIFALWFLLFSSSFFFPETCCTQLSENTGRKKSAKIHHLGSIAQLCRAISLQLKAKFHYAVWFEAGRRQVWSWLRTCLQLASNRSATSFELVWSWPASSWFKASSNLLEAGCRPVRNQIPKRCLVWSWSQTGSKLVANLRARASSLLAS